MSERATIAQSCATCNEREYCFVPKVLNLGVLAGRMENVESLRLKCAFYVTRGVPE